MLFDGLDPGALGRALAAILQHPDDDAEVFLERSALWELDAAASPQPPRQRVEEGFAVRLLRGHQSWIASRDGLDSSLLEEAIRTAARVHPRTPRPLPEWRAPALPTPEFDALRQIAAELAGAIGVGSRVTVRGHARWTRVIGPRLSGPEQLETHLSATIAGADGLRFSTLLVSSARRNLEAALAALEVRRRLAEASAVAEPGPIRVLFAPDAAAVLLHEAVAHALESDVLAASGQVEAAIGLALGPDFLDVLDDPTAAPSSLCRTVDDEGMPTVRRWLLRGGVVEQPIADRAGAAASERLIAGAGRRASRHDRPGPRSSFLEIPPGTTSRLDLLAAVGDGLLVSAVDRGRLDSASGRFQLEVPGARRIRGATLAEPVGPLVLTGRVADMLAGVAAIGDEPRLAGAGWCAKDGQLLPVWARTPSLAVLAGIEVGR